MNGAYKGGTESAILALSFVPCSQLHSAWLILEPGGSREINVEIAQSLKIFLSNYDFVGYLSVPKFVSGDFGEGTQLVYKPNLDNATRFCS